MSSPWDSGHGFTRRAFTTGVSWPNRAMMLASMVGVASIAVDGVTWATALSIALWWAVMQYISYDTYTDGWRDGKLAFEAELDARMAEARAARGGQSVNITEFLDLCERHGVPMQEVAQLIWREKP